MHIVYVTAIEVDDRELRTAIGTGSEDIGQRVYHSLIVVDKRASYIIRHGINHFYRLHTMCATENLSYCT